MPMPVKETRPPLGPPGIVQSLVRMLLHGGDKSKRAFLLALTPRFFYFLASHVSISYDDKR